MSNIMDFTDTQKVNMFKVVIDSYLEKIRHMPTDYVYLTELGRYESWVESILWANKNNARITDEILNADKSFRYQLSQIEIKKDPFTGIRFKFETEMAKKAKELKEGGNK